ncbi:uncharacterized protein LOC131852835 [Achroia grisella]|uniref:uncharacterized protein LOC131852835 n=1 Tax=Achroia grisella TaxID=688607 RepID=UPI0027D331AC|nr:uncharacterized protein LOC131852835 [Achroia grisella]
MGDFNTDLLQDTYRSRKLRDITRSVGLQVLSLSPTHTNRDCPDTWLDHIYVSSPDCVLKHGQFPAPGFSKYDLIYTSYNIKTFKPKPAIVRLRNFARIDTSILGKDVTDFDWSSVLSASSVNDKVSIFNKAVLKIFDKHVPAHLVKVKRQPAPLITRGVRMAMRKRDRAFGR